MLQGKQTKSLLTKGSHGRRDSLRRDSLNDPDSVVEANEDSIIEIQSLQEKAMIDQFDLDFKRKVHDIDPNNLLKTFEQQGLQISPLSVGQYGSLLKQRSNQLIPAVPELPRLGGAFISSPKEMPFLSFRQMQEFSLAACNTVQESFFESRNRWKTYHKKLFSSGDVQTHKLDPLILNSTSTNDQSKMLTTRQNDAALQLKHNKEQIKQIVKLSLLKQEEVYTKYLHDITKSNSLIKEQKIKVFPSKIIEEQKRKNLSKFQIMKNKVKLFDLYFYANEQFHVKPEMRESATIVAYKDKLYLYGGIGMQTFNSFWIMEQATFHWKQINQPQNVYSTLARNAHTMLFYKRNLIIFGGEKQSTSEKGKREYLADVKIFNIETSSWQVTIPQQSYIITARRNHSAVLVSHFMIVFGGIDVKSRFLNDVWIFDLATFKWALGEVEKNLDIHPMGVAFHQACAIYHPLKKYNCLYRQEELKASDKIDKRSPYQQEGMYVFGGLSIKDELIGSDIFLLKSDVRPMTWAVLETKGSPPSPRFGHSMNFNDRLGLVVIYGGRNHTLFMSDVHILRCDNLSWQQVMVHNDRRINRAFHCTTLIETKLYIFGGYAERGFVSSDVLVLELDSTIAKVQARRVYIFEQAKMPRNNFKISISPREKTLSKSEQKEIQKRKMIEELAYTKKNMLSPLPVTSQKITMDAAKKINQQILIRFKSDTEHFVQHELTELSRGDEVDGFKGRRMVKNSSHIQLIKSD